MHKAGTVTGKEGSSSGCRVASIPGAAPTLWPGHSRADLILGDFRGDRGGWHQPPRDQIWSELFVRVCVCVHFGRQTDGRNGRALPAEGAERGRLTLRPRGIAALPHHRPPGGPLNSRGVLFLALRSDVGELGTQRTGWKISWAEQGSQ